jgi:hypothetical protein
MHLCRPLTLHYWSTCHFFIEDYLVTLKPTLSSVVSETKMIFQEMILLNKYMENIFFAEISTPKKKLLLKYLLKVL